MDLHIFIDLMERPTNRNEHRYRKIYPAVAPGAGKGKKLGPSQFSLGHPL